jgi:hypothetical protein
VTMVYRKVVPILYSFSYPSEEAAHEKDEKES